MFKNIRPEFRRGNILKKEMLENLRDYPRKFLDYYFAGFSEGIISGVNLSAKEKTIFIGKGIIKFNDLIYLLDQSVKINYRNNNESTLIKVRFEKLKQKNDFKIYESRIVLDNDLHLKSNEFELGRFKLRKGAKLKDSFGKFEDFNIEYNTLNLIHVRYSAYENHTLYPRIIKFFAEKVYLNSQELIDQIFAAECLNSRTVSRNLILNYISRRLEIERKDYNNIEIYQFLGQILNDLSYPSRDKKKERRRQQIIVD